MVLLAVLCLFAPFPLLLVEVILPFPFIIEELFKLLVVRNAPVKNNYFHPLILGILFSASESVLYLSNFFALGNFGLLPLRLVLTTVMHTSLFVFLYHFRFSKNYSVLALVLAMTIHYFYNRLVG